jgi:SAM-dependent methyltransferase
MKVLQNYTFGLWKIITMLWFLFLSNVADCQQPLLDSLDKKLIAALNAYREPLLKDTFLIKKFIEIADKFEDKYPVNNLNTIIGLVSAQSNYQIKKEEYLDILLRKRKPEHRNVEKLKQDIDFVFRYAEPWYLIHNGIIDCNYPYNLTLNSFFMNELLACHLEPNEYVADIGAGDGFFSFLLMNIYRPAVLHLNEITPVQIEVIRNQYEKLTTGNLTKVDYFVGTKTATNLSEKYDKIIMRNTFHHFVFKQKMMEDIILKLKPDGKIIIIEVFKDKKKDDNQEGPGSHSCYMRISEKKFLSIIKKFPLTCVSKKEVQGRTIMEFQLTN